jgi:hypothetical protein
MSYHISLALMIRYIDVQHIILHYFCSNIYLHYNILTHLITMSETKCIFLLVGEWTTEWSLRDASKRDYQRYALSQLDVYSDATFGWAHWAYKCQFGNWSLKWMIENGYIRL